jgi:Ca-activated chloride channel homolog
MHNHRNNPHDGSANDDAEQLSLAAQFDKELIWERGRSVRYLQVDVDAPTSSGRISTRAPLNIALAIDVSGSMAGNPLKAAKEAAIGLINGLSEHDVLSIVSFSSNATVHIDGITLNDEGRISAAQAVGRLESQSDTNLSEGWLKAAECAATVAHMNRGYHSHVIVLSDGYANAGITNPVELEQHAEQLRMRGMFTSSVGIGDQYSSLQMEALAVYGGGRLHDAQYMMEIVEVVLGELHELSTTLFDDVNLSISFPAGIEAANLSGFPTQLSKGGLTTSIGSLGAGSSRTVIFRFLTPPGLPGDVLRVEVDVSWKVPGNEKRTAGKDHSCTLTFAPEARNLTQRRDEAISLQVARIWQAAVVKRAVAMNRIGKLRELQRYLDHEIKYFSRYITGLPNAEHLAAELVKMRDVSDREWNERSRKDMQITTHYSQQGHKDYRTQQRKAWYELLPEDD